MKNEPNLKKKLTHKRNLMKSNQYRNSRLNLPPQLTDHKNSDNRHYSEIFARRSKLQNYFQDNNNMIKQNKYSSSNNWKLNKNKSYNNILSLNKNSQYLNNNRQRLSQTQKLQSKLIPPRRVTAPVQINENENFKESIHNDQINFNELLPKSIKYVQSKMNIDKFIESESITNNLAIDNEGQGDEYVKVFRVLVDGIEVPVEELRKDESINNYLKSNGYDSYENNGVKKLRRRSNSKSHKEDSVILQ